MKISINPNFNHIALQLLHKCKTLKSLNQIHSHLLTTGLANYTYPLSILLAASSSISLPYSTSIFNNIPNPTIFLYNTFISSLLKICSDHQYQQQQCRVDLAFSLYNRVLRSDGVEPNCYTFPSLIKACCCCNSWSYKRRIGFGKVIHCHVVKFVGAECDGDQFVLASLVKLYAKIGDLRLCRYIFEMIREPDLVLWNTVISAFAGGGGEGDGELEIGVCIDALYVFDEMQQCGVRPNEKTLVALITACGKIGALSQGIWAHTYLIKNELEMNMYVTTSLIDMYAKCGCLDLAFQMFFSMTKRDSLCYNAMIGGFALHGCGRNAIECFEQMKADGLVPDDVTILMVLCGCSHTGLVDEAYTIIESMNEAYGIEPKVEHYACLVDLLGRAGRLTEAEHCVNTMPIKPNAVIWRSLLSAATVQESYKIGEIALENLIQLEPETSGNYVLLSNIYANIARFEDVKRVRKLMKDNAGDKMPGISLFEMDGEVHEFLTGDISHFRWNEIYVKLEEINRMVQEDRCPINLI